MKKFILFLLLTVSFSAFSSITYAQTGSRIEMLKLRAKEKVKQLNDYIGYMADVRKPMNTKMGYKKMAEQLFLNDCKPYDEIVEYEDGHKETIRREGVTMEVVSLRNPKPRKKPMPEYFRGIINLGKIYSSVSVETTEIADMSVSELKPYGNGLYICTVYFDQKFTGRRIEQGTYREITRKWAVVYVQVDQVIGDDGQTEEEYLVRLGDVHASSIRRVTK